MIGIPLNVMLNDAMQNDFVFQDMLLEHAWCSPGGVSGVGGKTTVPLEGFADVTITPFLSFSKVRDSSRRQKRLRNEKRYCDASGWMQKRSIMLMSSILFCIPSWIQNVAVSIRSESSISNGGAKLASWLDNTEKSIGSTETNGIKICP